MDLKYRDIGITKNNAARASSCLDDWNSFKSSLDTQNALLHRKTSSFENLMKKDTLDDVMREFHMNGSDSPYDPEEDRRKRHVASEDLTGMSGMGPSSLYLRQKSWPEPHSTPLQQLPRPRSEWVPSSQPLWNDGDNIANMGNPSYLRQRSWPANDYQTISRPKSEWVPSVTAKEFQPILGVGARASVDNIQSESITLEQLRVLCSLPSSFFLALLKEMEKKKVTKVEKPKKNADEGLGMVQTAQACRFCLSNGERLAYCRSHSLGAAGRVRCPVLRALVCPRCAATGDSAHTLKYCPAATHEDRLKSYAVMKSMRMASGKLRYRTITPPSGQDGNYVNTVGKPLSQVWMELEKKLVL